MTLGSQHSPLFALVQETLRKRILSGAYAQGERLVEGDLAEEMGVSRIPVREALRALAAAGLVRIEPRRGASVASLSPEHARDIVEVRATLEALNARLAAQRRNPQQVADMDRAIRDGARACERGDTAALVEQNRYFHELLGGVSTNAVLQDLMRSLRDRTALLFARNSVTRAADILDEHAGILQAVTAGDADLASLLAARHVHNAAQWYFEQPADRKTVAAGIG
ncbi:MULTISPECIES: GntR family transcriptional regulator [Bordetella]|uniref:GntR family transcriptional regulator n=1 Tax=Bordetella genomosp. 6 TaxID=463024 RepID=A0ABX4FEQ9_9BORD|nr:MULTISPECIES: GntR family transcriptional regulator [Bordetella]AOB28473.1 GntR family transcriptional regulator [Bordetella bronchiseptica]ARP75192.1 GntR family transcriptional regulator [Bordetella genomosp. 6]AZW45821.1 GntR family transcriptional regulator [Bordetella bronchiseptica]KCV66748.1 FCD domain protein [Bordetella bronchiseptica 99-R-0433]MBN3266715.1 GntR family transcriptional regulator [Bordetella bronchiseptica]